MERDFEDDSLWNIAYNRDAEFSDYNDDFARGTPSNSSNVTHISDTGWEYLYNIKRIRENYFETSLSLVCIVGNTLVLLVLSQQGKRLSPHVYMAALAVCDLTAGLCVAMHAFSHLSEHTPWVKHFIYHTEWVQIYLVVAVTMAANFLGLMLTVDRYIAVRFPFNWKTLCTPKRTCMVVVGIIVFCFAYNSYILFQYRTAWVLNPDTNDTVPIIEITSFGLRPAVKRFSNLSELILRIYGPFIGTTVINILLVHHLRHARMRLQRIESTNSNSSNSNTTFGGNTHGLFLRMAFAIAGAFLLTHGCTAVSRTVALIAGPDLANTVEFRAVNIVNRLLQFSNTCVNFFLYMIFCKGFRDHFLAGLQRIKNWFKNKFTNRPKDEDNFNSISRPSTNNCSI